MGPVRPTPTELVGMIAGALLVVVTVGVCSAVRWRHRRR